MFARLLWSLLRSSRGRLVIAILALASGGAVVSGLLNLEADVQRQVAHEFRTLGPNLIVQPADAGAIGSAGVPALLDESAIRSVKIANIAGATFAPYLYVVAQAQGNPVVVAGTWLDAASVLAPWWKLTAGSWISTRDNQSQCLLGRDAARALHANAGSRIQLQAENRSLNVAVAGIFESGGDEDGQIFVALDAAQSLAELPGKISVIAVSVPGAASQIEDAEKKLAAALPESEVRPVRQLNEAQNELASRLHLLIVSMVILILALTVLCVLGTMAALAVERRRDVALMRALGGSVSRVVGLFLAEAAAMGAVSGLVGYAAGIFLARWIGWRVFDAPISPRWQILPLTIALMTAVALAGALPLRLLGKVRPAEVLRGEA
jgi:putative ABC transport system permease protein